MSTANTLVNYSNKFLLTVERLRSLIAKHPEWLTWFLSLLTWALIFVHSFNALNGAQPSHHFIYCMKPAAIQNSTFEIQNSGNSKIFFALFTTVPGGLTHWIMMIIAMMFPLLNDPVKHVAFSIRRKDKYPGILLFLGGYTVLWAVAGVFFLLLPVCLTAFVNSQTPFLKSIINASGFLLAAALVWMPSRPVKMIMCSQTMPIRIKGWQLYADCFFYGLRTGLNCLNVCWAVMAALAMANHNEILMFAVTIVLIYERYLLRHTSKLPAFAWGAIALILFGIEMLPNFF